MLGNGGLEPAITGCAVETHRGLLYRAVNLAYFTTLTSGEGAFKAPNRYGRPGVTPALYLSTGPDLAMIEATRQFRHEFHMDPMQAFAIIPVDVNFRNVLDLTDPETLDRLQTSTQELTGDWRAAYAAYLRNPANRVPTHDLGELAFRAGRDAIKYPSAYAADRVNYVHFLTPSAAACEFRLDPDVQLGQRLVAEHNKKEQRRRKRKRPSP